MDLEPYLIYTIHTGELKEAEGPYIFSTYYNGGLVGVVMKFPLAHQWREGAAECVKRNAPNKSGEDLWEGLKKWEDCAEEIDWLTEPFMSERDGRKLYGLRKVGNQSFGLEYVPSSRRDNKSIHLNLLNITTTRMWDAQTLSNHAKNEEDRKKILKSVL